MSLSAPKPFSPKEVFAKQRELLARAADHMQEKCTEVDGDMNDGLAMEIYAFIEDTKTEASTVEDLLSVGVEESSPTSLEETREAAYQAYHEEWERTHPDVVSRHVECCTEAVILAAEAMGQGTVVKTGVDPQTGNSRKDYVMPNGTYRRVTTLGEIEHALAVTTFETEENYRAFTQKRTLYHFLKYGH